MQELRIFNTSAGLAKDPKDTDAKDTGFKDTGAKDTVVRLGATNLMAAQARTSLIGSEDKADTEVEMEALDTDDHVLITPENDDENEAIAQIDTAVAAAAETRPSPTGKHFRHMKSLHLFLLDNEV